MSGVPILVYQPRAANRYEAFLRGQGCTHVYTATTPEEALSVLQAHAVEVVFGSGFPTHLLNTSDSVRWLQLMSAGVDHVLRQGVIPNRVALTRMVGVFSRQMTEYVFGYLLHIVKDMDRLHEQQQARDWKSFRAGCLLDKVIGVAGLGSIGMEVVRKARAFDMRVHGLSRSGTAASLVDHHVGMHEWHDFVRPLDFLVLTLPLTNDTRHVVDAGVLCEMKPEAVLVNVGRGALVDEQALASALREGQIGGAVLDVFEQEPLANDSPLWTLPNVHITPHMSGPTTVENAGAYFMENLQRYEQGEALLGLVDVSAGY